jgi:dienelactone hydrolase
MALRAETVTYQADGLQMVSHFYAGDAISGPRPGILVFPEAFGLGDHARARAARLAGLGYAALASDLHGESKLFQALPDVMPIITALRDQPLHIRARARGAFDALAARAEVNKSKNRRHRLLLWRHHGA